MLGQAAAYWSGELIAKEFNRWISHWAVICCFNKKLYLAAVFQNFPSSCYKLSIPSSQDKTSMLSHTFKTHSQHLWNRQLLFVREFGFRLCVCVWWTSICTQGKWDLFERSILLKVKINLPDIETSRQRKDVAITVVSSNTMKSFFYRIALHGKDLFSYVLENSKAGLVSVFIHQHCSLLLFSIQKMEHICCKILVLITFSEYKELCEEC